MAPYQFSNEEFADMHFVYGFCNGNASDARREYHIRFPNRHLPSDKTFTQVHQRLKETGSFRSGRESVVNRVQANVEEQVEEMVNNSPGTSCRKIQARTGISKSKASKILRKLTYHPYHLTKVQDLKPQDLPRRITFCQWISRSPRKIPTILYTDEALFGQDGIINTRNTHLWAKENPHGTLVGLSQHRFSVNVWCGIVDGYLVGPFVLEPRLSSPLYLNFLQEELPILLEDVPLQLRRNITFLHDGAPPHHARVIREHLTRTYGQNWIGRDGPVSWPPRSPDLNVMDYYFWGRMKDLVYNTKPRDRPDLLNKIEAAANTIRTKMEEIRRATRAIRGRARICIEQGGGQFQQLL